MNKRASRPDPFNTLNGADNFGKILSAFGQLEIQCTEWKMDNYTDNYTYNFASIFVCT